MGTYFNEQGFLQSNANQRYQLSTYDQEVRSDLKANAANTYTIQHGDHQAIR